MGELTKVKPRKKQKKRSVGPPETGHGDHETDHLGTLARTTEGPSSLSDTLGETVGGLGSMMVSSDRSAGATDQGKTMTAPPEVGGGGADPLRWVMGSNAPSVSALRMMSIELEKEALRHFKHAPKTKESTAFLDAVRRFQGELGEFGALTSLAKVSGHWSGAGLHAATQLTQAMVLIAEMIDMVVERPSSDLPSRVRSTTDRLRAGRQAFYSGSAPYRRPPPGIDPTTFGYD